MLEPAIIVGNTEEGQPLEERYAYYRRCQVVRRNGEQCKAPAVKGERICYKHSEQRETMRRRQEGRRAVLEHALETTRRAGGAISDPAELFISSNGIQRVIAAAAQALIEGQIDCKTAGRLAVELQWAAKLLRMEETYRKGREGRKGHQDLPQMNADERRTEIGPSVHREIGSSGHQEKTSEMRCSAVMGRGRRKMERRTRRGFVVWKLGVDVRSRSPGRPSPQARAPFGKLRAGSALQ